jgi:hypothetical protein
VRAPFGCGIGGLVNQSIFGGTAAAVGTGVGAGLGDGAAQSRTDETEEEKFTRWYKAWRDRHPHAPTSDFIDYFKQNNTAWKARRAIQQYTNFNRFVFGFDPWSDGQKFMKWTADDFASGEMRARLGIMTQAAWESFKGDMYKQVIEPLGVAAKFWTDPSQWKNLAMVPQATKEAIGVSFDFWTAQNPIETAKILAKAGVSMDVDAVEAMQAQMKEFNDAVAAGDTEKTSKMIGKLAGSAEFQAIMAKGPDLALEKLAQARAAASEARVARGRPALNPDELSAGKPTAADIEYLRANNTAGRDAILYAKDGTPFDLDQLGPGGWDEQRMHAAAQIAAEHKCTVALKAGQPEALARQAEGALPKPGGMPPKSWDPLDAIVRPGENTKGYVLHSEPVRPVKPDGMSDAAWRQLKPEAEAFYEKRVGQFQKAQGAMLAGARDGMEFKVNNQTLNMKIGWEGGGEYRGKPFGDGVVYGIVPEDCPEALQKVLGPPGTRVPVGGDNDAFTVISDARKGPDGAYRPDSAFTAEELATIRAAELAVQKDMQKHIPGVSHEGDTPNWNAGGKEDVKAGIMNETSADNPTGQNVIYVNSSGGATVGRWPPK